MDAIAHVLGITLGIVTLIVLVGACWLQATSADREERRLDQLRRLQPEHRTASKRRP